LAPRGGRVRTDSLFEHPEVVLLLAPNEISGHIIDMDRFLRSLLICTPTTNA